MRCRVRAPSGATAFHIAASRGQIAYVKRLVWSLYHKSGGDSQASYSFGVVRSVLNSPGLKRGQGVVDAALASNNDLAQYLKHQWGGRELLDAPGSSGSIRSSSGGPSGYWQPGP